jgi:hypothetical protein
MTVLGKIKTFFKRPKPEVKGTEKKAVEPAKTKAPETPEKKPGESSWQGISSNGVRYFD